MLFVVVLSMRKLLLFVITYSDGTLGFALGGHVYLIGTTTQTWNNGSATKEFGNYLKMPGPAKIVGLIVNCSMGGNVDFILYSDPLGTPVAERTVSIDLNIISVANQNRWAPILFPIPYVSYANQPLAVVIKPTSATNVTSPYISLNIAAHQGAHPLGENCYAVSRASGAFAAVNANKDRFCVGVLVGGMENSVKPIYGLGI